MLLIFAIATLGTIGSVWLSRTYTGRLAQILLVITGSFSLWMLLIANYGVLIANPVPPVMGFGVIPIVSLVVMGFVIRSLGGQAEKEKRKSGAE